MMTRATSLGSGDPQGQPCPVDWPSVLASHHRWLRTLVYGRLRDGDATDEVMQEISLAAIRQQSPLRDPAKAGPWLYRLAVRQVLLYRRKQGRQRKLWDRYQATCSAAEAGDRSGDPLVWILSDERRSLIRTSLERLPERDAALLLLKYTEHWSYQQIAEHLGIGQAAVESRLHRARARLRAELTARDVFEVRR